MDKPYVQFARENHARKLKERALAKQERLDADAQKVATAK